MKTLSQREQEIQHSQERPFLLAEKLASNIRIIAKISDFTPFPLIAREIV